MNEQKEMLELLDMWVQPVFCVKNNTILHSNAAARQLPAEPGMSVLPLLETCAEDYKAFSDGCLYLTLTIAGQKIGASVFRVEDMDIFRLDSDNASLESLALAASVLRRPLSSALADAAALLDTQQDPLALEQLAQLNRSLYQLLRTLGNMSDAGYFSGHCSMETVDVSALFREVLEQARNLISRAGLTLSWEDPEETIFCLADKALLERALLNLLSNAAKFTPKGGSITASAVRRGHILCITLQDSGSGIAQELLGSLFQRHLRQPGIEDSRFGLGLGLQLVHAAARHHGGTLLVTQVPEGGTRVVLTLAIRQSEGNQMRSPVFKVDYTGGFSHNLVELSECLPADLFDGSY